MKRIGFEDLVENTATTAGVSKEQAIKIIKAYLGEIIANAKANEDALISMENGAKFGANPDDDIFRIHQREASEMDKYFFFINTDREIKFVNEYDIISINFRPYKQQFEIHVKGEAPQYFTIPFRNKDLTEGEAVTLIRAIRYNMAKQKHPVFNWEKFCKVKKVGG